MRRGDRGGLCRRRPRPAARRRTAGSSPAAGTAGRPRRARPRPGSCPPATRAGRRHPARPGRRTRTPPRRRPGRSRRRTPTGAPAAPARRRSAANRTSRRSPAGSAGVPARCGCPRSAAGTAGPAGHAAQPATSTAAGPRPARWPAASRPAAGTPTPPAGRPARPRTGRRRAPGPGPRTAPPHRRTRAPGDRPRRARAATATAPGRWSPRRCPAARGWWPADAPAGSAARSPPRSWRSRRSGARSCPARSAHPAGPGHPAGPPAPAARLGGQPQRLRDGRRHRVLVGDRGQLRQPDPVPGPIQQLGGHLQPQPGLPAPPAPVKVTRRADSTSARTSATSRSRPMNADSWAGRLFGSAGLPSDRSGGNPAGRPAALQLEDPLRAAQVLQPVDAQIGQRRARRQPVPHQHRRRLRHQHLPPVGRPRPPGRPGAPPGPPGRRPSAPPPRNGCPSAPAPAPRPARHGACRACCIASTAATHPRGEENTAKNASPCVSTSRPSCAASADRISA